MHWFTFRSVQHKKCWETLPFIYISFCVARKPWSLCANWCWGSWVFSEGPGAVSLSWIIYYCSELFELSDQLHFLTLHADWLEGGHRVFSVPTLHFDRQWVCLLVGIGGNEAALVSLTLQYTLFTDTTRLVHYFSKLTHTLLYTHAILHSPH